MFLYDTGHGVPHDPVAAQRLYALAAAAGHVGALEELASPCDEQ